MDKIPPFREIKNNRLILNLHPGQVQADQSKARFVAVIAGHQSGKTCYGPHWLHDRIDEMGEGEYLAVSSTYPLLERKMLPEFKEVFENILDLGRYKEQKKTFFYHDGKVKIFFGSADNPDSLESATSKAVWFDECGQKSVRRDAWEAVKRRTSRYESRVLFTTTPYVWGWFKTDIYDRWASGDPDYDVIQFESIMNPAFPMSVWEKYKKESPAWYFDMFCRGKFSRPAGIIYDSFDEDTCVIDRFEIPQQWPVYVGHDFGIANPAAMFYAQNPETGDFFAFHEYLPGRGRSTAQHVTEFKGIVKDRPVLMRVGGSHQEEESREAYRMHGWPITEPKLGDVKSGIDSVYGFHKQNKIKVFRDLKFYLDQKESYSYSIDDKYAPIDKIEDKEKYHLMDCERYLFSNFRPDTAIRKLGIKIINTLENVWKS